MSAWYPRLGATWRGDGTTFRAWAPEAERVELVLAADRPSVHAMAREAGAEAGAGGYFVIDRPEVSPGARYQYLVDGRGPLPDPASRFQPEGVHGPSEVIDPSAFPWTDAAWRGLPLDEVVIYETHVGTVTPEGTFRALQARLPQLCDLGVTVIELMPVADFPGNRNWGYDGVAPFAPARCYGRPDELRALVDAAHRLGLAVYLDVVYNHFGPDGAYQGSFSRHYFSTTHTSPWGAALNFDGPDSGPVRAYVVENALRWIHEYHVDGLRLDATHAIVDASPRHILAELADAVHA
jgi:maltooligosyltrehalose trehalohydrolase